MAVTVSLINMKGGVGKTTIASQLSHAADRDDLKVLGVDLDPQSNLSQSIMGVRRYSDHLQNNRPTVVHSSTTMSPRAEIMDLPARSFSTS